MKNSSSTIRMRSASVRPLDIGSVRFCAMFWLNQKWFGRNTSAPYQSLWWVFDRHLRAQGAFDHVLNDHTSKAFHRRSVNNGSTRFSPIDLQRVAGIAGWTDSPIDFDTAVRHR